jgi:hypothetical protein
MQVDVPVVSDEVCYEQFGYLMRQVKMQFRERILRYTQTKFDT